MEDKESLIGALAHWLAAGKLDARLVLPAMEELAGQEAGTLLCVLEVLEEKPEGALGALGRHVLETLRKEALQLHEQRKQGQNVFVTPAQLSGLNLESADEWDVAGDPTYPVEGGVRIARDFSFVAANQEKAPKLFSRLKTRTAEALSAAQAAVDFPLLCCAPELLNQLEAAWAGEPAGTPVLLQLQARRMAWRRSWLSYAGRVLSELPDPSEPELVDAALLGSLEQRFVSAESRLEQAQILDCICAWGTPALRSVLLRLTREPWAQHRALLNLTLRFGQPALESWEAWLPWLSEQERRWQAQEADLGQLVERCPQGLLLVLYSQLPDPEPAVLNGLVKAVADAGPPVTAEHVVHTWSQWMPIGERRALLGAAEPAPVLEAPPVLNQTEPGSVVAGLAEPPMPPRLDTRAAVPPPVIRPVKAAAAPPVPPKPSVWEKHIQPFFMENWYIVAGIVMVILGSSLLAYYTWDKHWLVRYTVMPLFLGGFTWSLAGVGRWLEKKGTEFKSTAAILRGAAIGLLPINFMAMALLSADENVPHKGPALLAMALVYLVVFGWGLRRWCAAVEPALGNLLSGPLLLLNALVAVGPLARTVGHLEGAPLLGCLGGGFYVGFLVTAWTLVRFSRTILTREMAEERRVPWFVAGSLALTFLQVFLWVHGFMHHVPQAHTYALLVIFSGWLVLYSERRALALRQMPQLHGGESFLGFALLLLGLLMGFGQPEVRLLSFGAAGGVWLWQALSRKHALHYWIALTLWALGGASVGLLPNYPGPWLPLVGVVLAVGFGLGIQVSQRRKQEQLADACRGMQAVMLLLTTIVAPLVQWHYNSAPLMTAGWLTLAAALFAWRAFRDQQLHWLHATMVILAVVLPYAGFVDMVRHTAHHNTMVFGLALLSWLWLGLIWWRPKPLLLQARSTVLWFYGILAVAAMVLRVLLGDAAAALDWLPRFMDYSGPLLMALALVPATFHSRSLVPAGMAVVIMAVLFPELKANLQQTFPWLAWGTGLGSACWGMALTGLCFLLRPWSRLKDLPEGDRFLGNELFPFRRCNHTLFTWPLLAAAVYLVVKVDTFDLLRNQLGGGVQLKTALALGITGIAWTFLGIYSRQHRGAVLGVHLGWLCVLGGIGFAHWRLAVQPHWSWPVLLIGLLLQGLYWLYRFRLEARFPWVRDFLTEPTRRVLWGGSAGLSVVCIGCLLGAGAPALGRLQWLFWFVVAQLVWHALARRQLLFGTLLFFQLWVGLLCITAQDAGPLWTPALLEHCVTPTLWLLVGIQLAYIGLERAGRLHERLEPLLTPAFVSSSAAAALLGLAGLVDGVHWLALSRLQQGLLLVLLLLVARAQVSGLFLLMASLLGYLMVQRELLVGFGTADQLEVLTVPWRIAVLALGMVLLALAGRWLHRRKPALVTGPFAQPFFTAPSWAWLLLPATILSGVAALYHTSVPALRQSPVQLWTPYLGAVSVGLVAWAWQRVRLFLGAGALLVLGNVHLVRVFGGEFLGAHGLSELHALCLGFGLSLLQASALRRLKGAEPLAAGLNLASLGLAGAILALLSANYFTAPNLAAVTPTRFVVSGTLAWLAGRYFRRAARSPGPGEKAHVELCEALYHFGLVLAIWCAGLLVPWLRQPAFTLAALCLPTAYFYAQAEWGIRALHPEGRRYCHSAAVMGFVVLALYVFKSVFHLVLFPGTPIGTEYYHHNAPLILVLGVLLLRLHGLGGTQWLAFYGGLALMVGSYFLLTWLPGFSPFEAPIPAAWCALGLGHFWILLSHSRSPLRSVIQRLARIEDVSWHALRRSWGLCLLAATQGATLWGIADYASNTYMVAPLLAGAATILIHQGIIRQSRLYLGIAALEVAVGLHLDFLLPSYLPKEHVIWVLLAAWLGLLSCYHVLAGKLRVETVGRCALGLAALVLAHVAYHRPWSPAGLRAVVLATLLAAWTPVPVRTTAGPIQNFWAGLLLWVPTWLAYFSQGRFEVRGPDAALESWPVLAATLTLFLTGLFARLYPAYWAASFHAKARSRSCLFEHTLAWVEVAGARVHQVVLWLSVAIVGTVQVLHYQAAFATREFVLVGLLEAGLAVAWFYEGKRRQSTLAYYLMQIAVAACCVSLRRQLMLTAGSWNYEYDVWASLVLSFALAGSRQVMGLQPRSLQVSLLTTMCLLPVVALVWVSVHGLGINMTLLVVGLHSVMFAYLGKDDRQSPYNIVALAGFVGFILLTFYSKLHLHAIHAYVIPVGLGVLVLQELFRSRIAPKDRNWIRLVTLMAMLGSAGYYALADASHAITFNLTLILLCLLAMGLGSFLRIRLYLALGFASLMVDLVSIGYKVLVLMERSARMTIIGSLVLVLGALLVFGAIYYKTNKAKLDALAEKGRLKLAGWE